MSILSDVRSEGYSDGFGQASQLGYDEAYYEGQCDARAEAPSRLTWWLLGVFGGYAIEQIVRALV